MVQAKLFLVDDSAETAFIVQRLARRLGLEVAACPDAETAWDHLQRHPADLALVDVNLPGASGLEFCRWVRAAADLKNLPLALFSHWHCPRDIAAGLEAGAEFVLAKDLLCQPQQWCARLREILAWTHSRQAPISLAWNQGPSRELPLVLRFNQMLRRGACPRLGEEVVHILLQQAAQLGGTPDPVLAGDGYTLDQDHGIVCPEGVHALVSAFVEKLWCLLGTADSAPLIKALIAEPAGTCE